VRSPGAERLGSIEFVVESGRSDARETDSSAVPCYAQMGLAVEAGARVVVEAESLTPIGVLDRGAPPPNFPAGFNPYFDPPIAA
jgi:hypothetical protein